MIEKLLKPCSPGRIFTAQCVGHYSAKLIWLLDTKPFPSCNFTRNCPSFTCRSSHLALLFAEVELNHKLIFIGGAFWPEIWLIQQTVLKPAPHWFWHTHRGHQLNWSENFKTESLAHKTRHKSVTSQARFGHQVRRGSSLHYPETFLYLTKGAT